jgi:hypothetical protein
MVTKVKTFNRNSNVNKEVSEKDEKKLRGEVVLKHIIEQVHFSLLSNKQTKVVMIKF